MLFAIDVPSPLPGDFGNWLFCMAMFLIIIDRAKAAFWPPKTRHDESATRSELHEELQAMKPLLADRVTKAEFQELKGALNGYVTRVELQRIDQKLSELTQGHSELAKYTNTRMHEMTGTVSAVQLRLEVLHREIHKDIETSMGQILNKLEGLSTKFATVEAQVVQLQSKKG